LRTTLFLPTILAETLAGCQAKLDRVPTPLRAFAGQAALIASPEEAVQRLRWLVDAGFRYFVPNIFGHDPETVDLLVRQVIPVVTGRTL
jgi:hypothetical protein